MKIFFTGGTGFVGTYLTHELAKQGHEITVLVRSVRESAAQIPGISFVKGDSNKAGDWQRSLAEQDAVINLAGASIFTRWSKEARRIIRSSRIFTTRHIVDGLAMSDAKGKLLISTSAVGYYGNWEDDTFLDENSPPGNDFLAQLCVEWEHEAKRAENWGIRVVIARFGIVLGKDGGALQQMISVFSKKLGSPLGSGKQWFSWIHRRDLFRIMAFLLENKELTGAFNCTAPNPVRNRELSQKLAAALGKPLLPSVPGFLIRSVLGEFGEIVLKGQRVLPRKLLAHGFSFEFATLQEALNNLVAADGDRL